MRLINKSVQLNEHTFAPELEMIIRIPLEPMSATNEPISAIYETLGKQLGDLIENKNETNT